MLHYVHALAMQTTAGTRLNAPPIHLTHQLTSPHLTLFQPTACITDEQLHLQGNKTMRKNRIDIQPCTTEKWHLFRLFFAEIIIRTPIKSLPTYLFRGATLVNSDLSYLIATKSCSNLLTSSIHPSL
ncbi:hypothetical protein FOVG_06780 [Fusarium oxysporum f. sp. pisi HDV247]|uniref:Uncharacterized protein n=1 Tax=Fusarium oxysporum f. sp. pisi HDV247 TaxID=1080344 RepID=W9Q274_FUSOX|nr:hypothetical protein FOVG_06780 [Fusarium oxysporum f. sp. pisi HDV247]